MGRKKLRFGRVMAVLGCVIAGLVGSPSVHSASTAGIATSTSLLWVDESTLDQRLEDIRALGAKWVRVDFNWAEIQPRNRDDYRWGAHDRVVQAAGRHQLKVMATLAYVPTWSQNQQCAVLTPPGPLRQKCSPSDNEDFARFARAAVIRYGRQGVHTWEIWNEPNLTGYWRTVTRPGTIYVDPAAYARTATAAAIELRNHDPEAFIITGGLAPMFDSNNPRGMRQSDYLRQLLPRLDPTLFDAVGIHPYSWPKLPMHAAEYNAFYTVDNGDAEYNLRQIMDNAGWADKQMWATEFGASTKGKRRAGQPLLPGQARPDHVTEDTQAHIIGQGVRAWSEKTKVGPIFVHADSDQWLMTRKNEGGFGLRRLDGTKKPAYDAFRNSAIRP